MAISAAEIYKLNHMNNVAASVGLGDLIQAAEGGGVSAGDIDTTQLADGAVTNAKIDAAAAIDPTKIALASTALLIGQAGGAGAEIILSGDATNDAAGVLTIGAKKVGATKIALTDGHIFVGGAGGAATDVAVSGDLTVADTGAFTIAALAVTNAKVSASAAIAFSKLATLTDGHILVGSGAGVATDVAVSGDLTLANTGAFTIANLAVTNAKVSATAAIAFSKLATLADGNILVGSGAAVATSVAASGDVTLVNTGAFTIAALAVTTAKINTAAVTVAKLDPAIMLEATGTLTRTNLLAMKVTPVNLIAAAAAGKIHIVDEVELFHDYDTAAYTGGGVISIEFSDGTDLLQLPATFLTETADSKHIIKPSVYDLDNATGTGSGQSYAAMVAAGIQITNATADFASGNVANIVKWRIRYHTVTALV